jgi:hypothetical protein
MSLTYLMESFMNFAIALYDALVAIHVPTDKAKAVVSALEHDMTNELATKRDLQHLSETFDLKLKALINTVVIRISGVFIAVMAAIEALHKYL